MSTNYVKSEAFLFEMETGTPGTYEVIGAATSKELTKTLELINVNNDSDPGVAKFIAGTIGMTGSLTVQTKKDDAGQELLEEAVGPTTLTETKNLRFTSRNKTITGAFYFTQVGNSSETGQIQTTNISFTCDGLWSEADVV